MARRSDDDDETVRDGESIRVPLYAMDGLQKSLAARLTLDEHRPGFRFTADTAAADAAREEMLAHLRDAWRTPQPQHQADQANDDAARKATASKDAAAARDAAYNERSAWLARAYLGGA